MDRGELVIGADEWPVFLYDEEMYDKNKEWVGLFLGETFVRVSRHCLLPVYDHSWMSSGMHLHIGQPFSSPGVAI